MIQRLIAITATLLTLFAWSAEAKRGQPLDPADAFRLKAEYTASHSLVLDWKIAEGYKLYRDQIRVDLKTGDAELGKPEMPKGVRMKDPTTGDESEIYQKQLHVEVPVTGATGKFTVQVTYQGCAEHGLCYPPSTRLVRVDPNRPGMVTVAEDPAAGGFGGVVGMERGPTESTAARPDRNNDGFSIAQSTLESRSLWKISLAFILFGLLLSLTPCVLPMIPILASIIVGDSSPGRGRSLLLALAYSLGMALVYTMLGIAAGLAGEGLAGALQQPWVLVLFAVLLVVLALSMFDLYQLQVPGFLQSGLSKTCGKLERGRIAGVFFMGALSALIVGPCVAAPLAGTLVYISLTRDVVLGGLALFSMATGMSVPLLLVGLSAGTLLPKAGAWMNGVKYFFGLLLLAVAIWMVTPVTPGPVALLLWGSLAILCAMFLHASEKLPEPASFLAKFAKTLGLLLLAVGLLELAGAAAGGTNPLEPLAPFRARSVGSTIPAGEKPKAAFTKIHTESELDAALADSEQPLMLDFYADWCASCKELEHCTFNDPEVRRKLEGMTLMQVDVTQNNADAKALMKRFGIFGPPAIIFFDASGHEIRDSRIAGFIGAEAFLEHLERHLP